MNRSKVAITNSKSNLRSRLAKAIQSLDNLKDYSEKPKGVWGSTATIKTTGGVTIKSDEIDLEFEIPFDDNLESNEGEIRVYNLSNQTINALQAKQNISIEAGYQGDTGVIFKGYIVKVSTDREEADRVTTIKVIDDIREKGTLDLSFDGNTTASYILSELIKRTNLPIVKKRIKRDWTYTDGVTVNDKLESAIRTYSEVCGVSTFVRNGDIYCCPLEDFSVANFNICEDTGMIGSPTPFTEERSAEGYTDTIDGEEVEMLLQHRMGAGSVCWLETNRGTGNQKGIYRVVSGQHTFNESECITKVKLVRSITTTKTEEGDS